MTDFDKEISECNSCILRKNCQTPLIPISDYQNVKLMVVAENPSLEEEKAQWGFSDRHNHYLKTLIAPYFSLEDTHFTYLVKCFVGDNVIIGKKNSKPCINLHLRREVEELRPGIVLCLGRNVGKMLTVSHEFGEIQTISFGRHAPYVGFWQASSYIHNAGKAHEHSFLKFLQKLRNNLNA